jgi:hypothetical protein
MKSFLIGSLLFLTSNAWAQPTHPEKYLEIGLTAGFTNYSGDLAEKTIQMSEGGFGAGVFGRYHLSNTIAVKAQLLAGKISGTDANASTPELKDRSLEFSNNLVELAVMGEWNFMDVHSSRLEDDQVIRVVPYLTIGLGAVFSQPTLNYYGPPDAYSQNVPYGIPEPGLKKQALVFPFGLGLRALITKKITVGIDGGFHSAASDYLDGVKKNGKANNDWYYTALASASLILGR